MRFLVLNVTAWGGAVEFDFKRHCTRQCLDCVLSRTVRTQPLPGEAAAFPQNPETEPHPKPSSKHVENASLATLFIHLKGGVHDTASLGPNTTVLSHTVRTFS